VQKSIYKYGVNTTNSFLKSFTKIESFNSEVLDKQNYIFCPNHLSVLDPLVVAKVFSDHDRKAHFLAKKELFDIPLFGQFLKRVGQISVDRDSSNAKESLKEAEKVLENGENIIIYPEGTSSQDLNIGKIKSGAIRLSQQSGIPIVPVGIWGIHRVYSKANKIGKPSFPPRRVKVLVSFGEPILASEWNFEFETNLTLLKTRMIEQLDFVKRNY
jgi:1-acyl-sn-glycerol-3-phosphate acyltransferase